MTQTKTAKETQQKPAEKDRPVYQTIAVNRRARFDYDILETVEAGIVLSGTEIKSVREGRVNLSEAYGRIRNGEAWLLNLHISEFRGASFYSDHDPVRARKLLLHRKQIQRLELMQGQQRLTLIPLRLYLKGNKAKVEIAVGRGRRQYDKRQVIAARDAGREMQRATKMAQR